MENLPGQIALAAPPFPEGRKLFLSASFHNLHTAVQYSESSAVTASFGSRNVRGTAISGANVPRDACDCAGVL
jgi:hypothetical protein